MPDAHPDDLTLADFVDGLLDELSRRRIRDHVDSCAICRKATGAISAVRLPDLSPLDAADLPTVPTQLLSAVAAARTAPFQPGQLWRVAWKDRTLLVAVVDRPTAHARIPVVAAAAADSEADDGGAVELSAAQARLGFRLRLHRGATASLPAFVFDVLLAELAAVPQLRDYADELHPLDPARLAGDALAAQLDWFVDATWLPETSQPTQAITTQAVAAGLTALQVAQNLDVPLPRAVQLLRGTAEPNSHERNALARLLSVPAHEIALDLSDVPDDLVHHLSDPALRPRLRARARRLEIDETAVMRQIAITALRPAARRAGRIGADLDWRQVIDDILSGEQP